MTDIWTPSDDLLHADPLAKQKLDAPLHGGNVQDDDQGLPAGALTDAAAIELSASYEDAGLAPDEPGDSDDDGAIEDDGDITAADFQDI